MKSCFIDYLLLLATLLCAGSYMSSAYTIHGRGYIRRRHECKLPSRLPFADYVSHSKAGMRLSAAEPFLTTNDLILSDLLLVFAIILLIRVPLANLANDMTLLASDVTSLKTKLTSLSNRVVRQNVLNIRGRKFASPVVLRSLADLAVFLVDQHKGREKTDGAPRSPSDMRNDFSMQSIDATFEHIPRTKKALQDYIFSRKGETISMLEKYLSCADDHVLAKAALERSISEAAMARAQAVLAASPSENCPYARTLSIFLRSGVNRKGYLNDEYWGEDDEVDGGAVAGMLLFSAAAGLPKPLLEVRLECRGSILISERTATIHVGAVGEEDTAEKLNLQLLFLEGAVRANAGKELLACHKVAHIFVENPSTVSPPEKLPTNIGNTTIIYEDI